MKTDELVNRLREHAKWARAIGWKVPICLADDLEAAADKLTADVTPVQHGRWEWFEEWDPGTQDHPRECQDFGWRCGECKTALEDVVGGYWDDSYEEPKLKFCPNCGAKMDEEDRK